MFHVEDIMSAMAAAEDIHSVKSTLKIKDHNSAAQEDLIVRASQMWFLFKAWSSRGI